MCLCLCFDDHDVDDSFLEDDILNENEMRF